MSNILATGFITMVDLSDPIISSTAPPSPVEDMLWMDISTTPPVLKIFKNGEWVAVSDVGEALPSDVPIGGYYTGEFYINKNHTAAVSNGNILVGEGKFIHPNSGKHTIAGSKMIRTGLTSNNGKTRYIMFVGHDISRFALSDATLSKSFIEVSYIDKKWNHYTGGKPVPFTLNDNDCIIAKIEEFGTKDSGRGIKRIVSYYENEDSIFEALTGGGDIQGIYKKDGMLFINAEYIATGKLVSSNGVSEFDLDRGTFRLGGTSSQDYTMMFDGRDLHFANGSIKWENLDDSSKENMRNVLATIEGGVRNVMVTPSNEILTNPSAYTVKVMLGTEDVTRSCVINWTASGIYSGSASGTSFTPSKGSYTNNESYIEVTASYKGYAVKDRIGISVSKQGATGATGSQGVPGVQGPAGSNGQTTYTWIKYADNASGGGMSDLPDGKKYIGMAYNKTTMTESNTSSDYTWSLIQGPQGVQGPSGANGQTTYTWLKYADTPTTGMSDNPTGKKYMGLAYNKTTSNESTNYSDYSWSLIKGDKGDTGSAGKGIKSITEYYLATNASSGITISTSGWTTTIQSTTNTNKYLWNYEKVTYTDDSITNTNPVIIGTHGATGNTGATGSAGKGIKSITEYYLATNASSGITISTSGWTTTIQTVTASKKYLWNYEVVTYTDNSTTTIAPVIIGAYGDKGDTGNTGATGPQGPSGTSITKVDVEYAIHTSATSAPTSGWQTTSPAWVDGKYIWSRTKTTYSSGNPTYSQPACITGGKGNTGATGGAGATGTGVSSITEEYYLSTSKTSQTGGSWTTTPPTWSSGKYMWTRSKIIYSNPTSTVYTTPVCDSSWEAVNEVEIGGRNLYTKTKTMTLSEWGCGNVWIKNGTIDGFDIVKRIGSWNGLHKRINLKPKTLYTLSAYIKGDGRSTIRSYAADGTTNIYTNFVQGELLSTTWKKYIYTIKTGDANSANETRFENSLDGAIIEIHALKLEEGNKATDWTPAPEDFDDAIGNIQVGVRNLVSNSSPISSANWSTSTGWSLALENDSSAINGKVICVTNNSASSGGVHKAPINKARDLINGEEYTVSAFIKASKNCKVDFINECMISANPISVTTSWKRYIFSSKIDTSRTYSSNIFYVHSADCTIGMKLYIHSLKLEKGNKATDWSPAPEDVDGNTVSKVETLYYLSTSPTTQAGGSWSTTMPATAAGKYIWTKSRTTLVNGSTRETSPALYQMDWVQDWNSNKTEVGGQHLISPKIFAGTKNSSGQVTGVALGKDVLGSGTGFSGLAGYKNGTRTFHLSTDGTILVGQNTSGNHLSFDGTNLSIKATNVSIQGSDVATSISNAQNTANGKVDKNQNAVFNALTNNGQTQGIYLQGDKVYINGEYMKAKSLNAGSLMVGDFNNYAEYSGPKEANPHNKPTVTLDSDLLFSSEKKRHSRWSSFNKTCKTGDKFKYKYYIDNQSGANSRIVLGVVDKAGTTVEWLHCASKATGTKGYVEGIITISHNNAFAFYVDMFSDGNEGSIPGNAYYRDLVIYKMTGGDMIVNGSITANMLHADAINGKTIRGATITSEKSMSSTRKATTELFDGKFVSGDMELNAGNWIYRKNISISNGQLFSSDSNGGIYVDRNQIMMKKRFPDEEGSRYIVNRGVKLVNHEIHFFREEEYLETNDYGYTRGPRIGWEPSTGDAYMSSATDNWLRLKQDKTMTYAGYKVYTSNDKPTPKEIGALPSLPSGNTYIWAGTQHLNDKQTITPSKKLSDCNNGWVILWSDYNVGAGSGNNYDYAYTYIRKNTVNIANAYGVQCVVGSALPDATVNKYIYVSDTQIKGHANNATAPANTVAIRAVYEF